MWFPSVSLWWSLDRCPLVPLVNYGCGPGGRLIPALMCTDRWAKEEVNKPFHPSSGCTLRRRMPLCALIIHSNRTVTVTTDDSQFISQGHGASPCVGIQSIQTPAPPRPTSEILRTIKLVRHMSGRNIPHIKSCQILSLEKKDLHSWHYEKIFCGPDTASGGCNHNHLKKPWRLKALAVFGKAVGCIIITGEVRRATNINTPLNSHLSLRHPLFLPMTKATVELSTFCLCSSNQSSAATCPDTLGKKTKKKQKPVFAPVLRCGRK